MRNLRVVHHLAYQDGLERPPSAYCWDVDSNSVICTYGPTENDTLIELKRWHDQTDSESRDIAPRLIASWDAPCPSPDLSCDQVVSLQYFSDTSTTCLIFAGGDIVYVRDKPLLGEEKIEIVGSIDVGIAAAAWAPDEELLVICTNSDTLLFMTRDFDSTETVAFSVDDLRASKHVSVGWGKSETQFKGKGAKALRDPTVPEKVDQGLPSSQEDYGATITWRGDGQYVAISSMKKSDRRVSRVYTRDGILDAVSEPVDHLDPALSWRPAGNIIAGVQRNDQSTQVVFFERNGLRHGQFDLRLSESQCQTWASRLSLHWNVDSTVLAVCYRNRVQLWTMSNYHYSLKQEIILSEELGPRLWQASWHPESPLSLLVGSVTGHLHRFELISTVCHSSTLDVNGNGAVAVIDGARLKLTPMKYSNMPPPMALYDLGLGSSLVDVAFYSGSSRELLIAALTLSEVVIFTWGSNSNAGAPLKWSRASLPNGLSESPESIHLQQVQFLREDFVLLLYSDGTYSKVHGIQFTETTAEYNRIATFELVQELVCHPAEHGLVSAVHRDGRILQLDNLPSAILTAGSDMVNASKQIAKLKLPIQTCCITRTPHNESDPGIKGTIIAVSLTKGGHLYANSHHVASGCTSFLVTVTHIIFTTSQNLLKFIHMADVDELEVPADTPESDERCRSVERGARLISVIPSTSALVLQMPRGNLETIYPRALVLAEIRRCVDAKRYMKAFKVCRTHRVDMNIIHDHKPRQFLVDVHLFIDQVKKIEHIDLFLSQIREEDVSLTMYKETSRKMLTEESIAQDNDSSNSSQSDSKVNCICNAFLKALRPLITTHLQNVITAHVCKSPPDLKSGLREVAKIQKEDMKQAEMAVEHICFLVDVNRLFDAALGLYDIKLALLVAQQAQKDPKEYLPFLQKLLEHTELRRKFEIDNHLGRYSLCLEHLKDIGDFVEFKDFMVKHEFYGEALSMYKYHDNNIEEIMNLYGEYLTQKSRHQEAGVTYEYLKDFGAACESYRLANSWREALSCAHEISLEPQELKSLATGLADGLIEAKDYYAAATIKMDHLGDSKGAAQLLCKGYHFADATRVLSLHGKADLIDSVVDAGLIEAMASTTEMLAECKSQINAQVPRLRELRIKKEQDPLLFFDADVNGGAEIPDNVSLAGTDASTVGSTLFTRYTNRSGTVGTNASRKSSKNKRREERKRARGKKGSVYEEEYLVNSIGRLIERINSIGDEVKRLIISLVRRRMMERARAVESAMLGVTSLCQESVSEVFQVQKSQQKTKDLITQSHSGPSMGDDLPSDIAETENIIRSPPEIKPFEGLLMLKDKS